MPRGLMELPTKEELEADKRLVEKRDNCGCTFLPSIGIRVCKRHGSKGRRKLQKLHRRTIIKMVRQGVTKVSDGALRLNHFNWFQRLLIRWYQRKK